MRNEFSNLRFKQLKSSLESFRAASSLPRPKRGWIYAIRETLGVSTGELGRRLGTSRQLPLQFEKAEADDSITLKSLRRVGKALDCELVYALVPRALAPRAGATRKPDKTRSGIPTLKGERSTRPARTPSSQKRKLGKPAVEAPAPDDEAGNPYYCD
jgi:transcriptional regulator with XRE-family HTH domain